MRIDDSERRFEEDIESSLLAKGYRKILSSEYDLENAFLLIV